MCGDSCAQRWRCSRNRSALGGAWRRGLHLTQLSSFSSPSALLCPGLQHGIDPVGCWLCSSYIHHSGRQALHTTHDAMLRPLLKRVLSLREVGFEAGSHGVHVFSYNMIGQKQLRQFSAGTNDVVKAKRKADALERGCMPPWTQTETPAAKEKRMSVCA